MKLHGEAGCADWEGHPSFEVVEPPQHHFHFGKFLVENSWKCFFAKKNIHLKIEKMEGDFAKNEEVLRPFVWSLFAKLWISEKNVKLQFSSI